MISTITSLLVSAALALSPLASAALPQPSLSQRIEMLGTGKPLLAACCKICRKGKACGDSCISRDKNCRKGAGCACDG
ncbi:hypothetical protein [Salipiger abyssi]|uniref:hypothetical protein n=1 Tax=Salipiger abyssi TaxID=1250539 RepID=UPI001A90823E|nr:hypothetical protein [Salipiger abyssi]MBN9886580.1 hypothetical protein [Salipiger abyssi]